MSKEQDLNKNKYHGKNQKCPIYNMFQVSLAFSSLLLACTTS